MWQSLLPFVILIFDYSALSTVSKRGIICCMKTPDEATIIISQKLLFEVCYIQIWYFLSLLDWINSRGNGINQRWMRKCFYWWRNPFTLKTKQTNRTILMLSMDWDGWNQFVFVFRHYWKRLKVRRKHSNSEKIRCSRMCMTNHLACDDYYSNISLRSHLLSDNTRSIFTTIYVIFCRRISSLSSAFFSHNQSTDDSFSNKKIIEPFIFYRN